MRTENVPLQQFHMLTHEEQVAAIHRLAAQGWSDHDIARCCGLHLEQVRRALSSPSEHADGSGRG